MIKIMAVIMGILYYSTQLYSGIQYEIIERVHPLKPEVIRILDIDMNNEQIRVENGLSFGVLYGFETTSTMVEENKATMGVNGMFYNDLGLPYGIMVRDGKPIRAQFIGTPTVLIDSDNQVSIANVRLKAFVNIQSQKIELYGFNGLVPDGKWVLFDEVYGKTTRVRRLSTNYLIRENRVVEIMVTDQPVELKGWDHVLTYVGVHQAIKIGDSFSLELDYGLGDVNVKEAFGTGAWLVKYGINVAKDYEPFMGYTTAYQPRTLVGVTKDNHLIFAVVDGRLKGESLGMTGQESAKLMLELGCIHAAYLDGGSSSTMVISNKVINEPSGGEERAVAHSILIYHHKK
ncbi:phosphodiester glycosidase family protein [Petrocella sp. FN5]|uniref:phosphodiester glycosidase family protein n=1 Tax=Petrocella sp. FN5 TaxID=3032002 RepID=UPI0023DA782B|nr:phosphodiester glycosidase family protein [Petrocella sp. FN5]MDF1618064.1 phosphodiester glycosidase family protein [Petrocella sp. FN5]